MSASSDLDRLTATATEFLAAWNTQNVSQVLLREGLIAHNVVQFDRGALLPLLSEM